METTKTKFIKAEEITRKWHLIDATGKSFGRLASQIAHLLIGKHKVEYAPQSDLGDYVVVINARDIKITGKKLTQKTYRHYSGYQGGMKITPMNRVMEKYPERVLEKAVRLMLPKNTIGRQMYRRLRVNAGPEHSHEAQQPIPMDPMKRRKE